MFLDKSSYWLGFICFDTAKKSKSTQSRKKSNFKV